MKRICSLTPAILILSLAALEATATAEIVRGQAPARVNIPPMAQPRPIAGATHVIVNRPASGRAFGWPANGGIWNLGSEILVMYLDCPYKDHPGFSNHDSDQEHPSARWMTSRSTDGGQTWQRPFDNIPLFDFKAMTDRTDYEVTGRQSLTAHMSCTEVSDAACVRESSYAITTDDGGVTWNGSLPKSDFLHLLPASPCLGTGVEAADLGAFPVTRPVKE